MRKQELFTILMALTLILGLEKTVAGDQTPPDQPELRSFKSRMRLFEQGQKAAVPPVKKPLPPKATPKFIPETTPEATPEVIPEVVPEATPEATPEAKPEVVLKEAPKVAGSGGTAISPDIIPGKASEVTIPEATPGVTPESIENKKETTWNKGTPQRTPRKKQPAIRETPQTQKIESTHDCSKCSKEDCRTNKGRYEFCKLCFGVDIDKKEDSCLKGADEAGFINMKADFKQMNALSEGKGIKAKDVLPRFQSITTTMTDLHNRITRLKKNQKVFLKKEKDLLESIDFIKQNTGLKNPNIDPEQELKNYDAVLMTSISGGISGLSVEVCKALVSDFDHKVESNFKSFFSKTKRFVNSTTKREQEDKQKKLKTAVSEMNQGCDSWKLETQLAGQQKKDVYEVLQGLWAKTDAQLQDAQTLFASKP